MSKRTLAGMPATAFLRRHWQKRPLVIRQAFPQCGALLTREALYDLAANPEVQSRLVIRSRGRWRVEHGPFRRRDLDRLPPSRWTLLVQGVDRVLPRAQDLLRQFSFIPYARLDDIMISFAPPGGGVGPHFDSYDVFLLQLAGTRRWRISGQRDLTLVENAPLRILRRFRPQKEWVLHPGDLLYLPPQYAHDGVAIDECLTCSIGFRAPSAQELGTRFLEFLQDELELGGIYRDPDLALQRHPAQISDDMLRQMRRMIGRIRWNDRDVARFVGRYLTEPRPEVVFEKPRRPLARGTFLARARRRGIRLALKTQMLCHRRRIFVNGEHVTARGPALRQLLRLADLRRLPAHSEIPDGTGRWLYQWYVAGYIELEPVGT